MFCLSSLLTLLTVTPYRLRKTPSTAYILLKHLQISYSCLHRHCSMGMAVYTKPAPKWNTPLQSSFLPKSYTLARARVELRWCDHELQGVVYTVIFNHANTYNFETTISYDEVRLVSGLGSRELTSGVYLRKSGGYRYVGIKYNLDKVIIGQFCLSGCL